MRTRLIMMGALVALAISTVPQLPPLRPAARAQSGGEAAVKRPLPPHMVEAFGEGQVVALSYLTTYYCPTTPASDLDPPFGLGDGHPQSEDASEYQVPPCFLGDTGTGSILPPGLAGSVFPEARTFWGIGPVFGASPYFSNNQATDVDTHCSEPGPPVTQRKGDPGTCLMHPSTLRIALIKDDPMRQLPDPLPLPQHDHIVPETSFPPSWWNIKGVLILDRSIWPDRDGDCPAGPPACVTSVAALRAAQANGLASRDFDSNIYFFMSGQPVAK